MLLTEIPLSTRTTWCLKNLLHDKGVKWSEATSDHVSDCSLKTLLVVPNLGKKSMAEIVETWASLGLPAHESWELLALAPQKKAEQAEAAVQQALTTIDAAERRIEELLKKVRRLRAGL